MEAIDMTSRGVAMLSDTEIRYLAEGLDEDGGESQWMNC